MLFVPLPFIVAMLLLSLLFRMRAWRETTRAGRLFSVLIAGYATQSIILGLRWGYDLTSLLHLQPVLAALLAAFTWACFREVRSGNVLQKPVVIMVHALPAFLVAALTAFWPRMIDFVLIAIFLGYGTALARLALAGPDGLKLTSFEGSYLTYRALQATASLLIISALLELLIAFDFALNQGVHAADMIGFANLIFLFLLGLGAGIAGRGLPPSQGINAIDVALMDKLDEAMRLRAWFQELDLSLDRLSRKMGIPARRISNAINRVKAKNVSQYINDYRIAEACRLLMSADESITTIMLKVGFQTKSNFNREFRRVTGVSPSQWRALHVSNPKI
jgi:AraC-like DNA-binding protein